ncbi:MAG: class I SAM-dependent methyltransferase [Spirochaetes bacterium]|nr:class I SAM-dependent methyltransferase [Spirochaetota bacterium]
MSITRIRENFIDRTARKPEGKMAVRNYNNPKAHYKSFNAIMKLLQLKPEDTYCEIGCGGGVLLRIALEKANKASAIDHSPDMVDLAQKNNETAVKQKRAEILPGDAEKLPWKDNSFSACGCANMFFFIEYPQKALGEIYRVLKPGGRFAMATMSKGILGKLTFGILYKLKIYSNKEMHQMFTMAGFSNIVINNNLGWLQMCYAEKT